MKSLGWTKFQDFYVRVGFLKVLVALLDPDRRSVAHGPIIQRVQQLLCQPYTADEALRARVDEKYPWFHETLGKRKGRRKGRLRSPEIHEALILLGECASQANAITNGSAYKVLDWARDLGLVGRGNQITENGLILRRCSEPCESVKEFLAGDPLAWNPFIITDTERLFLLFHLCEIDLLTVELLDGLSSRKNEGPVESSEAAKLTCRAFFKVLHEAKVGISTSGLLEMREARKLATKILQELDDKDFEEELTEEGLIVRGAARIGRQLGPESPRRVGGAGVSISRGKGRRKTRKQADHQTVPRFELLVDLRFLGKVPPTSPDFNPIADWNARANWVYETLPSCEKWSEARRASRHGSGPWVHRGFASTAFSSGIVHLRSPAAPMTLEQTAIYFWGAYEKAKRWMGNTPFRSVAISATVEALLHGHVSEIRDFHRFVLAIKKQGVLPENIRFSGGNDIENMYLLIRPGFVEGVKQVLPGLEAAVSELSAVDLYERRDA